MYKSLTELDELNEMRENIRRTVEALEVCWSCQRVSECEQRSVDDSASVWLCPECFTRLDGAGRKPPGSLRWPSAS